MRRVRRPVRPLDRRVIPDDLPADLSLAVMDVCGAPALTARVVAQYDAGASVAVIGGAGKSGSLSLAAARDAGAQRTIGVVPNEARGRPAPGVRPRRRGRGRRRPRPDRAARRGGHGAGRTGRRHRGLRRRARLRGRRDPGHRRPRAPSSSSRWPRRSRPPRSAPRAWPPTSRCWSATATSPATRTYALELLREQPGVRGLFERRLEARREQDRTGQARPRPGHRPQGAGPGPQGRPADRRPGQAAHHRPVERATLRLAGLAGADADGTPWVNRLIDVVRADVGLEHGVALPVWDALLRGEADDLATLAQKAAAGSVTFRLPEGRDADRARRGRPQAGRGRAQADRRPAARARADDQAARRRPAHAVDLPDRRDRRHLRGHPAGPAGRPRGRRRDRGDPLDRPEPARLRARGRDPRGLRRHLRHPGELPADAGRARRVQRASSAATSG